MIFKIFTPRILSSVAIF